MASHSVPHLNKIRYKTRKQRKVKEIVESEFFQDLQQKAEKNRRHAKDFRDD